MDDGESVPLTTSRCHFYPSLSTATATIATGEEDDDDKEYDLKIHNNRIYIRGKHRIHIGASGQSFIKSNPLDMYFILNRKYLGNFL